MSYQIYQEQMRRNNNADYIEQIVSKKYNELEERKKIRHALYNPKTEWIHVVNSDHTLNEHEPKPFNWKNYPRVINHKLYRELKERYAKGQVNDDQAKYGFYSNEFVDEALRFNEKVELLGSAVITSTEFPAVTVTSVNQALLNRQQLIVQKYNLLGVPQKITTDQLQVIFPEYNDTQSTVRVGYRENDPIDTIGYGAFTQTAIEMKKAGAGMAFTEEYYMRQFTIDVEPFMTQKIANDFIAARHSRILAKLAAFTGQTGNGAWGAYTAGNLQSTYRPILDLNAAKIAIDSDKLATTNTVITNLALETDYDTNTWTRGFAQPDQADIDKINNIINNVKSLPWLKQWIINEDIPANTAYVLFNEAIIDIEGPRKTTNYQNNNPQVSVFLQKEWFDVVTTTRTSGWGRKITGI